jgi:hypothetical protein
MCVRGQVMEWIKLWLLERIIREMVVQGFDHQRNVVKIYYIVAESCRDEFTEDNKPTLDSFLIEAHREALDAPT